MSDGYESDEPVSDEQGEVDLEQFSPEVLEFMLGILRVRAAKPHKPRESPSSG